MVSINYINVFICLLLQLMVVNSSSISRSEKEGEISWKSSVEIQEMFASNTLEPVLFPTRSDHMLDRETRSNRRAANSNRNVANLSSGRSHSHSQHRSTQRQQSKQASAEACGTECKRERDTSKMFWEESLKAHILKSLNMTSPPQISDADKLPNASRAVQDMVEEMNRLDANLHKNENGVKKGKLLSVAKYSHFDAFRNTNVFFFSLSSERREDSRIKTALLKFYVNPDDVPNTNVTVILYMYLQRNYSIFHKSIKISRSSLIQNRGWTAVSYPALTERVERWISTPAENYGIALASSRHPNLIATGSNSNEIGLKPYLEIEFAPHSRQKRSGDSIRYCDETTTSDHCCIFEFDINFSAIGWSWVIYPPTYRANYCAGHCTVLQHTSVHTSLVTASQSNMTNLAEWKKAKACCVPKEYEAVNLLYYDHQKNIIYSVVPDMKILRCGCA